MAFCVNNYTGVKEQGIYWFHPDHLGSSSYITGADGEVTQNIEYFPSGETFVENHRNSNYSPYKFNGKELDAETGYYYYGARYYNPRVSLWLNVDPLAEKYPGLSPYIYCANNPINAIDPDGNVIIFINGQHGGSGGKREYWDGLDQVIANRFQDYHARYYDGALGGWLNTLLASRNVNTSWKNRKDSGFKMGYSQAAEIYANLKDGETIKLATHSMGGAYGKGFEKGLKKYAKENGLDARVERVLDLATFQGSSLETDKTATLNEQIAHTNDGVAGVSRIQGENNNFNETRQHNHTGPIDEHSVNTFKREVNSTLVKPGNPSTAQPRPRNGKIIVDYQQNK